MMVKRLCAIKCDRYKRSAVGEDTRAYAPIQPHIWQTPVECNHITGHQIELVNLKELLHFLLVILRDVYRFAHLTWTLVAP